MKRLAWVACLLAMPLGPALAQQKPVQMGPRADLELTVYSDWVALVKDTRTLDLTRGLNEVEFTDIPSQLETTSVHLRSLTAPTSVVLREQNYRYDLADRELFWEKCMGKTVTLTELHGSAPPTVVTGTLVGQSDYDGSLVLKTADKLVLVKADMWTLPALPDGLVFKPTLNWSVECSQPGSHRVEISYLTSALAWTADYVAVINADDTLADLDAWVTVVNASGATYPNARLKLVAGDLRRVSSYEPNHTIGEVVRDGSDVDEPRFKEKPFFEYHLYTLDRPTTVGNMEKKQIELLAADGIPVRKLYSFDGQKQKKDAEGRAKAEVKIEFVNSRQNNLGVPLPKGKVRVYKADDDQSLQFAGEDVIDHTPKDEKVRLYVGNAFDVVGERHELDRKQLDETTYESTVEVKVRNHKTEDITVTCVEHASGDWKILKESLPSTKKDAQTFEYSLQVPKDGEATVTYTIRVTRPTREAYTNPGEQLPKGDAGPGGR